MRRGWVAGSHVDFWFADKETAKGPFNKHRYEAKNRTAVRRGNSTVTTMGAADRAVWRDRQESSPPVPGYQPRTSTTLDEIWDSADH